LSAAACARTTATSVVEWPEPNHVARPNAGGEMLTLIAVIGILAQADADQQWLSKLATAEHLLREVSTVRAKRL
jgi:hypothetical protein